MLSAPRTLRFLFVALLAGIAVMAVLTPLQAEADNPPARTSRPPERAAQIDSEAPPHARPAAPTPRTKRPTPRHRQADPAPSTMEPTAPPEGTEPASETAPRPDPDPTLAAGDEGHRVLALQQRLADLGYWLGTPDGTYGTLTTHAVMAFQKAEGLQRDGVAGPATRERLATADRPAAAIDGDGLQIDLERQLLLVVQDGHVVFALHTATGAPATPTPAGTFVISREIDGLRHAPLGTLYRPKYFNKGIAVHGSDSLPAWPASHGCARISNAAMDLLWSSGFAQIGTTVVVH